MYTLRYSYLVTVAQRDRERGKMEHQRRARGEVDSETITRALFNGNLGLLDQSGPHDVRRDFEALLLQHFFGHLEAAAVQSARLYNSAARGAPCDALLIEHDVKDQFGETSIRGRQVGSDTRSSEIE